MDTAKFVNQTSITVDEIPEDQVTDILANFGVTTAEATFKSIESSVNSEIQIQLDSVITSPNTVNATVTNQDPIDVVVMRVGSTTTVVDTGVIFKTAIESGTKYTPLYTVDDNTSNNVGIARNTSLSHAYSFIGIALDDFTAGEQVPIKINNTITDLSWAWDLDKELLLGDGELVQEITNPGHVFILQVATVLTPNTIIITRNQPVELL